MQRPRGQGTTPNHRKLTRFSPPDIRVRADSAERESAEPTLWDPTTSVVSLADYITQHQKTNETATYGIPQKTRLYLSSLTTSLSAVDNKQGLRLSTRDTCLTHPTTVTIPACVRTFASSTTEMHGDTVPDHRRAGATGVFTRR